MSFKSILLPVFIASLLLFTPVARSEEGKSPSETWQDAAYRSGLSAKDISSLEKNRILITNEAYRQVFSAYLSGDNPLFITSDSLLNAYHVLFEESIFRLENAMAAQLPPILRMILTNMEDVDEHLVGKPSLVSAAKRRAVIVTGIALKLMDDSFRFKNDELDSILTQETRRIVEAEGVGMPAWLGKPDASLTGIDYSRYKPRGFYTRSEQLKRYFRAVSWLQSIPFRVEKDDELLAILMLGNCVTYSKFDDYTERRKFELFFSAYSSFIGSGDDWDIMTASQEAQNALRMSLNGDDLQKKRELFLSYAEGYGERPQINDQIRFAPEGPQKTSEPHFRIISAHRTPSAILFQRTTDLRKFGRSYPQGLEVSVALGSGFARKQLDDPQKDALLETINSCKPYFDGGSLHLQYLNALKALVDKPEPDAPDFMKNESWEIKSCNTALSGWAQMRHTWSLQAKQTILYLGMTMVPEGFVEPEPEFFSRMAGLAAATRNLLEQCGVFEPNDDSIIQNIEKVSRILDGVKNEDDLDKKFSGLSREDTMGFDLPFMLMQMNPTEAEEGSAAYFKEQKEWLDALALDIKEGRTDRHPMLKEMLKQFDFDLEDMWERLGNVCRRLEVISHKELRHVDLNEDEVAFIKEYGNTIAGIMLYGGNSYLTPRDDAPRVVDVYANPQGGYLHVGVARPRKLYVLYPWKGKTILCEGAVMPYYEFAAPSRLTDESFKEWLDSDKRPPFPEWISPMVSGGSLSKPSFEEVH